MNDLSVKNIVILFFIIFIGQKIQAQPVQKQIQPVDSLKGVSVVYIGYGTQKQREVIGSISTVNSNEFNRANINNPVQLIQGKVAGLDISKPGGEPNGSYYIRLRGLNTIGCNTQPLIVINGMSDASLENVDPNDIESITVLKDGSASAIYGTRASNGIILVTTKRGKTGTFIIDYNVYATAEKVAKNEPAMNSEEWRALNKELGGLGRDYGENTNWMKEIEQTALSQVHNLSMSGGTDKTTYRASINFRKGEGVAINTGYTQLNGRLNLSQKAMNDKLTLDLNLGVTNRTSAYGFSDAFKFAPIMNPTAPVRMPGDPAYAKWDNYYNETKFDYYNPVQILEQNVNDGKDVVLNLYLKGTYELAKDLYIDAFYSTQKIVNTRSTYFDKNSYWVGSNTNGMTDKSETIASSRLFESTIKYNGELNSSLSLSALGGYSYQDFTNEGFNVHGGNYLTDAFTYNNLGAALDFKNGIGTAGSYKNSNQLIAFFGRVNLNINSRWFVTASARYEGSSRFGANHKWGLFPAVGSGVDLTSMVNASFINYLRVRANYGLTGNQPSGSYLSLLRFGPQGNSYYNGKFIPTYNPVSNSNEDLRREKKSEFDTGFDFSIFRSSLSGSFDYYTSTATDLLFDYYVLDPSNLYVGTLINIGIIKSCGVELSLNYNVIKKSDFNYNISFTWSHNLKNTLVSLSGVFNGTSLKFSYWEGYGDGYQELGYLGSPGGSSPPIVRSEEGKPIGQLVAYKFKEIDKNGNLILEDINADRTIDSRDRIVVGNGLPEYLMGFGNDLTYKNWDLNIFFRGVFGHDLINNYRASYGVPYAVSYYNVPKITSKLRNPSTGTLLNSYGGNFTDRNIENASFISLDNIFLGYNFGLTESSPFSKIRIYLGGNNLFYITGYKGSDPNPRYADSEQNNNPLIPGVDRRNTWPRTRSVTFGVNVVF
jgi:iron complex outermembrane receptor protein